MMKKNKDKAGNTTNDGFVGNEESMGIKKGVAAILTATILLTAGCNEKAKATETILQTQTEAGSQTTETGSLTTTVTDSQTTTVTGSQTTTETILQTSTEKTMISLKESSAQSDGAGCVIQGTTITITNAGTYVIQGKLENGEIIVDAGKESLVHIILNGAEIKNEKGAAIYIKKSGKTVVTLADGTENILTDGAEYQLAEGSDEPSATLYSKSDLAIGGTGTLHVNGNYGNAIQCKDSLELLGGTIKIKAAGNGIIGKDMLLVEKGTYIIEAGLDGMKSTNSTEEDKGTVIINDGEFKITAGNDAIQAETDLTIIKGVFELVTGGGSENAPAHTEGNRGGFGMWPWQTNTTATETDTESTKGIKAGRSIQIENGSFLVDACDDAIHSNGTILIRGGDYTLASGDDGIHADTTLTIQGGNLRITKSYEGLEATEITIDAGTISITASDDGINAANTTASEGSARNPMSGGMTGATNAKLTINGGEIKVMAQGDGLDSNGSIIINAGVVSVDGPTGSGNGGLDYETTAEFNGGVVVIAGSVGMAALPTQGSQQASIAVTFTQVQTAGTEIVLYDSKGQELLRYTPQKQFQHIILCHEGIKSGESYRITYGLGGTTGTFTATGAVVTSINSAGEAVNSGGFGGRGGFGGAPDGGSWNKPKGGR